MILLFFYILTVMVISVWEIQKVKIPIHLIIIDDRLPIYLLSSIIYNISIPVPCIAFSSLFNLSNKSFNVRT